MKKILTFILIILLGFISINITTKGETELKKKGVYFTNIMNSSVAIVAHVDDTHPFESYKSSLSAIYHKYSYLAYTYFRIMNKEEQEAIDYGETLVDIKVNLDYINNNPNQKIEISKDLYDMLYQAEEIRLLSNGYFDYSIGKIIDVWKEGITKYDKQEMPETEFNELIETVKNIEVVDNPMELTIENEKYFVKIPDTVKLDLGAFAKGYATQKAVDFLKEKGVKYYLINAGTSSIAAGEDPENDRYSIKLMEPVLDRNYYGTIHIKNTTATTSGNYEQYFTYKGERYHHIISPKTKTPVSFYHVLTIAGEDAGLMDASSTALFSMSSREAKDYLERINAEAVLYQTDLKIVSLNGKTGLLGLESFENKEPVPIGKYLILGTYIIISITAIGLVVRYFVINKEKVKQNPKLKTTRDIILFGLLILVFGGAYLNYHFWPREAASYADITYRNEIYVEIDFNQRHYNILKKQDENYPLVKREGETLEVTLLGDFKENGVRQVVVIEIDFSERRIKVSDEKSPNNLCSKQGWTKHGYIICLPNSVTINFRTGESAAGVI